MNFKSFPEITSERLLLRKIKASDAETILFLRSYEAINKFIKRPESKKIKTIADAKKMIENLEQSFDKHQSIAWGISLKDEPQLIGTIGIRNFSKNPKTAEVGYDLDTKFHRKGIMNEALQVLIPFAFNELKLEKIEAFTHFDNAASIQLLQKNEFQLNKKRKDSGYTSNIIFELENAKFS
ncbi:GNAT family N-acetyltransferase [Mesonia ostreae]|uniref:GNAT family N-acetyltransferase n=1 Tax=Mesonia ostreae TaxID=861110 RepID=A0ABU2KGF8_9FLAO|nr:GNAT family N-acetyltransferase [Mesonia ostreae]MDT0293791.1 GNAT family N-acetyltransferase [Mesonia ostreae]